MSSFDPIGDSAFHLRTEGQEIKISFKQGVPATGQGTVEWTIPSPANGCNSQDEGAYAGIVILLRTEAMDATNIPQDGTVYVADPTADFDLSTADRIGDALVIGAIYECEKKSRGEDLTTSIVINDLKPGVSYYVAGYATDCQYRYHSDGIRAYSDMYGDKEANSNAFQAINLGTDGKGILPSDGTGLVAGTKYDFDLIIDDTFPEASNAKTIEFSIDGADIGTYQELLAYINKEIVLIDNPPQSPVPPNTNSFFWDATKEQLYQFDGQNYNSVDSLVEPTDPANVPMGAYWFDTTNKVLNRWNIPNPTGWNVINYVESETDLTDPDCDLYWFDGTTGRQWNGSTWCDQETLISITDPSDCPTVQCGTYWYDENTQGLFSWGTTTDKWEQEDAIFWPEAPNQLSNGTYWFNDTTSALSVRAGTTWNDISSTSKIQETKPSVPVDGMLWYKPSTEELKQYSATASPVGWNLVPVLVWQEDPTVVVSCSLWWNSVSDNLYVWDELNSEWDSVALFIQSAQDPSQASAIAVDAVWYNSTNNTLQRWDGGDWVDVSFINKSTDPLNIAVGDAWYKLSTNEWKIWDTPAAGWNIIDPTDSPSDPNTIPNGTYWFDITNNALFVRNGVVWITVSFSTVPFIPSRGSEWYDSTNEILYYWDGSKWIESTPIATAYYNNAQGFTISTIGKGSNNAILIPTPEGSLASTSPCSIGTGYAYHGVNDIQAAECEYYNNGTQKTYPTRDIADTDFLWSQLSPAANVLQPQGGNDGVSGVPSYMELGVGDDGTPDERRELMENIRSQLGYPVVEVELTNYQLDTCIQGALESFRKRSGASVRRGFYFLDIEAGKQNYKLTNKVIGYNRIVNVMGAFRFTSAFLSSAHGAGVYGQVVLQHLYNMGTYDLTSFFLVSQYIEQLEHLFATRLTFGWHEHERLLSFYNSFVRNERVLLDVMVERTEQDLLTDRYIKTWIERYALSEAMMMLAHIRGKFASLPGAGGGISLNASELIGIAQSYREELLSQVDEFLVDTPEDVGMHSTFILG